MYINRTTYLLEPPDEIKMIADWLWSGSVSAHTRDRPPPGPPHFASPTANLQESKKA